ncbi:hypothetical protein [Rhabdaerophilum sp. SD176]|uniref:hypothetical protein n=1 Tax=Rhabdaerophilum sp. SD176 TaxID=2983548 RepID=UPI0024DF7F10|nr:hypothetical protein [Rhabdaerophilum sp. SD176]
MLRQGAVPAGAGLFGLVFAAGFVLGTLRELVLRHAIGPDVARLLELPVMITLSWLSARWILRRAGKRSARWQFEVGLIAFLLLMAAEMALGILILGRGLSAFIADLFTLTGMLSFLAQALLIVMPRLAASATGSSYGRTAP